MRYVIDRIEDGGVAVIEDENGVFSDVPVGSLPEGAREGTCLRFDGETYEPDPAYGRERRRSIRKKHRRIFG